jgi:hypothetical protein
MEKEGKLSTGISALLIGVAITFDFAQFLIGFIPVLGQIIGWFISATAGFTFWLWFRLLGISFSRKKRGVTLAVGGVVEMIPFLNMLPVWTSAVVRIIISTKTESVTAKILPFKQNPQGNPQTSPQTQHKEAA